MKPRPHYTTSISEGTCDDMFGIVRCSVDRSAKFRRVVRPRTLGERYIKGIDMTETQTNALRQNPLNSVDKD